MYTYTNEGKKWRSYSYLVHSVKYFVLLMVIMYAPNMQNGLLPFGVIWSNNTYFRDEIVHTSDD